ncbi:MAG: very short patch repair endonuclease [Bacteroidota bacterium]|nr:very short patch repair endonuclease [Bacteroidota bacterium]
MDIVSKRKRSWIMSRVSQKNTPLEKIIQRELRKRGIKFSHHVKTLPGSPDIVFQDMKIAVFVDGDFWHGWRFPVWEHKLTSFWHKKISTNRKRDQRNFRKLRSLGWRVIRIWQHQLINNKELSIQKILQGVSHRRR